MLISLIFGLVLGGLTVIFALQNMATIEVTFLVWKIDGSLALILLAAALMGAVVCALLSIPEIVRDHIRYNGLKNQNKELQDTLDARNAKVAELETKLAQSPSSSSVIF